MKTDLFTINSEHFNIFERKIVDETVYLVYAKTGAQWCKENLIYRSSVWAKDGELISPSFKKFFNWGEQPDIDPRPFSLSNCSLLEKIDGSTLIVSKYKNNLITRTRGSIDLSGCQNYNEIDEFKISCPKAFNVGENQSYIYEWASPTNRIILEYKQPKLFLIAVINHSDYSMLSQEKLDEIALEIGVDRPRVFKFKTIDDMIEATRELKDIEGFCVYYNHDQSIRKVKTVQYLTLHRFKFNLQFENVLDIFLLYKRPKYNEFIYRFSQEFDWECVEFIKGYASKICDSTREVDKILDSMKKFADSVRDLSRKEAAEKIISAYGNTSRSSFVFDFLSNKDINTEGLKKLYIQVLGKL